MMETMEGCVKKSTLDVRIRDSSEVRRRTGRKVASVAGKKGRKTDTGVFAAITQRAVDPSGSAERRQQFFWSELRKGCVESQCSVHVQYNTNICINATIVVKCVLFPFSFQNTSRLAQWSSTPPLATLINCKVDVRDLTHVIIPTPKATGAFSERLVAHVSYMFHILYVSVDCKGKSARVYVLGLQAQPFIA